jgi:hypothetical protein
MPRPNAIPNRARRATRPPALIALLAPATLATALAGADTTAAGGDAAMDAGAIAALPPDVPRLRLVQTALPPEIDGRLDEPVWQQAAVIESFRQVVPLEGAPPSEATEVRLLYDAGALYIGVRAFDRAPDGIVATQMRRDADVEPDDRIAIVIDPFLDRRNGFYFEMNPVGARVDGLVEGNDRLRLDWDGIWRGRAAIDGQGWVAELAIPYKTIAFDAHTSRWGFNLSRTIRRRNEIVRWSGASQDKSLISIADAGVLEGIEGITQGLGLDIKPFGVVSAARDHARDRDQVDLDGGLDAFYRLTSSTTLALTLNTDFAETEVDERRVNLTRFPLFFPEKRDFFLQDAGIFNFGGIRMNPLPFFSRRIGIGPDGAERDILAGLKVTGREGGINFGLLDVHMKDDETLGEKNLLAGRVALNVLEESTVGAIFTAGDPVAPGSSWLAGGDFNYRNSRFAGDKTVTGSAWYLQSDSSGAEGARNAFGARVGYPNDRVSWEMGFTQIDDQFDAALGFVPRRGIREYFGHWRHRWRPNTDLVRSIETGVFGLLVTDLDDRTESQELNFDVLEIETPAGDQLSATVARGREVLFEPFEIADGVVVPAGSYREDRWSLELESSEGRRVGILLRGAGGGFLSGTRTEYGAGLEVRASRHLTLGAELEYNDVELDEGAFITRLLRGRVNVYFTPDVSWLNFVQYDNVTESVGINSRLRIILDPGSELFIVVNQAIDREGASYRVARSELTTKLGWTIRF